jgi:hypothetical protein
VLHGRRDDVKISGSPQVDHSFEDHVVGFASSGREDNLFWLGVNKACNLLSCLLNLLFCSCAEKIAAGGVAENLFHDGRHDRGRPGINRGRGVVIQIDEVFHIDFPMSSARRIASSVTL